MTKIKYRVSEYKIPQPQTGFRYFVEIGRPYEERTFLWFYSSKINWEMDAGFKTMEEAIQRIGEIKQTVPIFHEIR
jgi:hypothetical protein